MPSPRERRGIKTRIRRKRTRRRMIATRIRRRKRTRRRIVRRTRKRIRRRMVMMMTTKLISRKQCLARRMKTSFRMTMIVLRLCLRLVSMTQAL
jgi:hypothetical protein